MNVMKLIAGLGNPGSKYVSTRHNVGFDVLDRLARRYGDAAPARSKFHAVVVDVHINDEKVLLVKPTTFMNRSGVSLSEAANFYKLNIEEDVLVLVDDVALPCGSIRMRPSGSAGGHNGLIDIEERLGSGQYARLRIGIDEPGQIPQKDYVLGRFREDQREQLEPALEDAVAAATCWVTAGTTETMNRFNRKATA